ncbi:MAG TPA: DUF6702 family protein [Flavobacteriales bacterium]|nr:DUF6702 family protein [Flavobacteriales bacterium]
MNTKANLNEKSLTKHRFRQILVVAVLICVAGLFSFRHPYHVAVTTLDYNFKGNVRQLKVEYKAFYHDMEDAVNKFSKKDIDIKNHDDVSFRDSVVYAYMGKHFKIMNDGKAVKCSKAGITFKDEHVFINYLASGVQLKKIKVVNSVLYDVEKHQVNMFHFNSGSRKESGKIEYPLSEIEYEFKE